MALAVVESNLGVLDQRQLGSFDLYLVRVSWFTGVPYLFHRFDLVVGGRRLPFRLPRIQLRILGSLSAGDS